ncbi:MAG: DNA internalization-related competence protein ComEC/Rec2 [Methylophilaceae bacterium]|nr:MAG: DNA internalization-related competence protein ComEC/Rec2 [Methylophilaceae bacterium]
MQKTQYDIVAAVFGFTYAAIFATVRLSDELPKAWEQKNIEVVGVVASLPEVTAYGERFYFNIEQIVTLEASVPKHIVLSFYQGNTWHQSIDQVDPSRLLRPAIFKAGQRWQLTVRLKRPHTTYNPHGYDFEAWALANNIRAMGSIRSKSGMRKISDFVWRPSYIIAYCREKIGNRITQVIGDKPYAGVIRALVVGDDSQISKRDWNVYLRTGTNHLMSISGLHITMLAGLAFSLIAFCWRRFPNLVLWMPTRKAATIGGAFIALIYACLAGLSVPTQRTLYMLATFAVALLLSQRIPIARVLAMALMVVVLLDPWAVIAPGFWLSFSAVAFITFATIHRLKVRHWLVEAANTQWAVTLGLLPFLIVMFGQASIISPIANALAIPIISLLVVPLAILGALLPIDFILHASQKILEICMYGLNWLASAPFSTWQQAAAPVWTIALAILGVLWLLLPRGFPQRWLGLLLMLPMLFVMPVNLAEGEMNVTVLDVGQGLSVVVKTATHVMVYDTGQKYHQESDVGSQIIVPYLRNHGIKQLDALVISHDDSDHSGGAASVLAEVPTTWIASSYALPEGSTPTTKQLKCYAGQQWVWDAVRFEVLYPHKESYQATDMKDNNRSCVIKVTSRYGSILLTGDIEKEAEQSLLQEQKVKLKSDIMIAPHHGSKTSSTEGFISAAGAKHVIFTVGYLNRFKHPKPLVMSRYLVRGASLYRSDYHGAVIINFTKQTALRVNAWRSLDAKYWHDDFL